MKMIKEFLNKLFIAVKETSSFLLRGIFAVAKAIFSLPKKIFLSTKKILILLRNMLRNPKIIIIELKKIYSNIKHFFKKLPKNIKEYFFWLVMSPQSNVWRLQRKKIKDIPTVAEIKEYQKYLRKKTFKFVLAGAMIAVVVVSYPSIFQKYFAQSRGYQWIQASWGGGKTSNTASQLTGWTQFSDANDKLVTADVNGVKLKEITQQTAIENTSGTYNGTDYNGGNYSGVKTATISGVYAKSNTVTLKKPDGSTCEDNYECISGGCNGLVCTARSCEGIINCGDKCYYSGVTFQTVIAGGKCWLGASLPQLYDWAQTNGMPASCNNSAFCAGSSNGVCPWGWHVSTQGEWTSLIGAYAYVQLINGGSSGINLTLGQYSVREENGSAGCYAANVSSTAVTVGSGYAKTTSRMVRCVK